nr:retrovirus-related Pol polyprotein from transposon TNT 1-94 [Tanacetum cinerariifolium]
GFELPQEEVILIRRSERTHQAPNRLCLNVEVDEHSLGDLNEPTSYKAAMLDSESKKWIDAMNAKIQSMIENMGYEALVKRDTPDKLQQRSVKCIFIGYPKKTIGHYFYFPPENKIVVARYAEFFKKNLITHEVSERAIDLEEIQDEDTPPSEITSKIPMEVDGFELPQEE